MAIYSKRFELTPFFMVIVGIFELLSFHIKKYLWLRRQLSNKSLGGEFIVTVDESGYTMCGPFGTSQLSWKGVDSIIRSPHGVIIRPQTGSIFYIPEKIAGKELVEFVCNKAFNK